MRAAVVRGSRLQVTDLPEPDISEDEILVGMRVCGVCGTDLYKLRSRTVSDGAVLGHEFAGVVRQSRVSDLSEGDRVFVPHHIPCGKCELCLNGSPTMCPEFKINRMDPGGFAQFIRVLAPGAQAGVKKLPPEIAFTDAALIEPLGCCVRSVRRSGMQPGDTVLVVGAGQVGTYHIMMSLALGADRVIACDIDAKRLEGAEAAGAQIVVDANGDPIRTILDKSSGGVDAAFVTSESSGAFATAVGSVREGGTVVLFAHGENQFSFDPNHVLKGERTITASYSSTPKDHSIVLDMIVDGTLETSRIDTLRFPLEEAPEAADAAGTGQVLRVIIECDT